LRACRSGWQTATNTALQSLLWPLSVYSCWPFYGLGYSLFPWLVVDRITIWQGTSSVESLWVIFIGTVIVLPVIVGYTAYAYRVFWGQTASLSY